MRCGFSTVGYAPASESTSACIVSSVCIASSSRCWFHVKRHSTGTWISRRRADCGEEGRAGERAVRKERRGGRREERRSRLGTARWEGGGKARCARGGRRDGARLDAQHGVHPLVPPLRDGLGPAVHHRLEVGVLDAEQAAGVRLVVLDERLRRAGRGARGKEG